MIEFQEFLFARYPCRIVVRDCFKFPGGRREFHEILASVKRVRTTPCDSCIMLVLAKAVRQRLVCLWSCTQAIKVTLRRLFLSCREASTSLTPDHEGVTVFSVGRDLRVLFQRSAGQRYVRYSSVMCESVVQFLNGVFSRQSGIDFSKMGGRFHTRRARECFRLQPKVWAQSASMYLPSSQNGHFEYFESKVTVRTEPSTNFVNSVLFCECCRQL